jgi:hypothetical protein
MKLELHEGSFLKNPKMIFESFKKIGTNNFDVDNYEIY